MSSNIILLLEYPSFQHIRRNELSLTLSPAVQKPDQAEAAYKSFPYVSNHLNQTIIVRLPMHRPILQ